MSLRTELDIDIENYLSKKKTLIDNHIKKLFEEDIQYKDPSELWDVVRYSLLNGGKRIRGILCLATYESLIENRTKYDTSFENCLTTACSIELIHSMSLIHDDLPSMDNDDMRRGKPSCHKAFGEAQAILAGDAMLSLAFQLLTEKTKTLSSTQALKLINTLSKGFSLGLVPGQILDLSLKEKNYDLATAEKIYTLKTAELIKASIICGAIIALDNNQIKEVINPLSSFGLKLGTAFQIIDDILDITSDKETLGKTPGKDKKQNKLTYPSVIGIEGAKKLAKELISQAKFELKNIRIRQELLSLLAERIINRIH